jgi:glycosyltransferase involved in cell wall biosynthesis
MSASPTVALLRVLPEERLPSIDRFAVELQDALKHAGDCDPRELMFHPPGGSHLPRVRRMFRRFIAYPRALSTVAADVYHVVDQSYSHLVRFLPRDRSIVTCHDLTPLRVVADGLPVPQSGLAFQRYRLAVRALPGAGRIACDSHTTRGDVLRFLDVDPARVVVISPGIHPRFRPLGEEATQHARSRLGDSRHIVLHVDSGLPYKNVDGTLRVLAKIRDQGLDATLVRVGREMSRRNAELADSLALSGSVIELGRVSDNRLVEVYNAADVLLFPSHHEGFGWPPLEAMSCGTPVVASDCPPLEETIAGAGLSAPAQDIAGLSEASARVLSDESLANRLSAAGRRRAAQFEWADCAAEYADLYRTLARSD